MWDEGLLTEQLLLFVGLLRCVCAGFGVSDKELVLGVMADGFLVVDPLAEAAAEQHPVSRLGACSVRLS